MAALTGGPMIERIWDVPLDGDRWMNRRLPNVRCRSQRRRTIGSWVRHTLYLGPPRFTSIDSFAIDFSTNMGIEWLAAQPKNPWKPQSYQWTVPDNPSPIVSSESGFGTPPMLSVRMFPIAVSPFRCLQFVVII
jgi:hypothetical protein